MGCCANCPGGVSSTGSTGETPTYDANGESCVTTLEYLGALEGGRRARNRPGRSCLRRPLPARAPHVRTGLYEKCWSVPRPALPTSRPEDLQPAGQHPGRPLRRGPQRPPAECPAPDAGHRTRYHPGRHPQRLLLFPFLSVPRPRPRRPGRRVPRSLDPWRKLLPLHFSTWPESPAIPAPTPTPGPPTPSTTCSLWLPASNRPAPASPPCALPRIWVRCPRSKRPSRIHRGKSRSNTTGLHGNPQIKGGSTFHADIYLPGSVTGTFQFSGQSWPLSPARTESISR